MEYGHSNWWLNHCLKCLPQLAQLRTGLPSSAPWPALADWTNLHQTENNLFVCIFKAFWTAPSALQHRLGILIPRKGRDAEIISPFQRMLRRSTFEGFLIFPPLLNLGVSDFTQILSDFSLTEYTSKGKVISIGSRKNCLGPGWVNDIFLLASVYTKWTYVKKTAYKSSSTYHVLPYLCST